jgi:serine protease Do
MKTILTSIVTSLFTVLAIFTLYNVSVEEVPIEEISRVDMSEAIESVYDATVYIDVLTFRGGGSGSGFVYDYFQEEAYIITNHHVIDGAKEVTITFSDGSSTKAEIVASDAAVDIAVLVIPKASALQIANMGNSDEVKLGEKVVAIGSPLGFDFMNSVTQGYVSGLNRTIDVDIDDNNTPDSKIDLIQIDAAINPGNSGGPLVDSEGNVIGVNTIKKFATGIESMGFSIPINQAVEYANELREYGKVIRPTFGIGFIDVILLPPDVLSELNVHHGIYINQILEGRPASKAGLIAGDVIVSVNGALIDDVLEFTYQLYKYNPGDEIVVEFYREGELQQTMVLLDDSGIN